ncbi:hypothetical protein M446_4161 [Methylobacterium sp. 4-46]|uniref:hypothetical protein n=1 Tax=unclassified Methylobacterium TaxID=2615210 RepID=UPI000152C45D|nr:MULTISPECIES: hypothetical protein [Methylobacterium]ACA18518.1 hypothetical protein M446_4161 [Methylobacterium sp. 4-46]WFT77803.1 hypothetical protein QA634_21115 [Methylobacterium nodulans]
MTAPFALSAFELFLRAAEAAGSELEVEVSLTRSGEVVLHASRVHGKAVLEFRRFLVRGHSAIEVSVHDRRYKPLVSGEDIANAPHDG